MPPTATTAISTQPTTSGALDRLFVNLGLRPPSEYVEPVAVSETVSNSSGDFIKTLIIVMLVISVIAVACVIIDYYREKKKVRPLKHLGGNKIYSVYMDNSNGVPI
jgi:hypothetical protein